MLPQDVRNAPSIYVFKPKCKVTFKKMYHFIQNCLSESTKIILILLISQSYSTCIHVCIGIYMYITLTLTLHYGPLGGLNFAPKGLPSCIKIYYLRLHIF